MLGTHLLIFSTHLPTSQRKRRRSTAVSRCVLKFRQSALDKDVSGAGCDESAYIQ